MHRAKCTPRTCSLLYVLSTCMKYVSSNISTTAVSASSTELSDEAEDDEPLLRLPVVLTTLCASTCVVTTKKPRFR